MNIKDVIGTTEAAKIAGVGADLFRYYVRCGYTPAPIKIGKFYFFERKEIQNWQKPDLPRGGWRGRTKKKKHDEA